MIEQVPGHRSYKWLMSIDSTPVCNYAYLPNFPLMSTVLEDEFRERTETLGNNISYHYPRVIQTLPKPNCSVPALESSPHLWHFKDSETEVEFLVFSDGLRKNHFKGTTVEVLFKENEYHKDDAKLAAAYSRLLEFIKLCYTTVQSAKHLADK